MESSRSTPDLPEINELKVELTRCRIGLRLKLRKTGFIHQVFMFEYLTEAEDQYKFCLKSILRERQCVKVGIQFYAIIYDSDVRMFPVRITDKWIYNMSDAEQYFTSFFVEACNLIMPYNTYGDSFTMYVFIEDLDDYLE